MFWQTVYSCKTKLIKIELIIYIKMDLALNNLQRLICHKTKPIQNFQRKAMEIPQTAGLMF